MKVQRARDISSTEEQWRGRKHPAHYSDPADAAQLLKKIKLCATPTAKITRDAPSAAAAAATSTTVDTTTTSTTVRCAEKDHEGAEGDVSCRHSHPNVSVAASASV